MSPQLEQDIVSIPIELMKLEARHLPGALKLSQEMGWPYRLEDWEFAATVGSGLVLERAGQVIGTAMSWIYGKAHASVGMIIVTGSAQGGGNGSRLFDGLLEATQGRNVLLTSTEEGLALYKRRGFTAWGTVLQHQGLLTIAVTQGASDGIASSDGLRPRGDPGLRREGCRDAPAVDGGGARRGGQGRRSRTRRPDCRLRHHQEVRPRLCRRPLCSRERPRMRGC